MITLAGRLNHDYTANVLIFNNKVEKNRGYLTNTKKFSEVRISQGDSIHVLFPCSFDNYVVIEGQVKNPGKYPFHQNLFLSDLINATMSRMNEDFSKTMDLSKILIFRKSQKKNEPEKLVVQLDEDIMLKNGDHITISKKNILQPIESIIILGEVKTPGIYPVNNQTTLNDILSLSGGLTNNALKKGIEIFRDSLKIGWNNNNFLLKGGDSLNVLKKQVLF